MNRDKRSKTTIWLLGLPLRSAELLGEAKKENSLCSLSFDLGSGSPLVLAVIYAVAVAYRLRSVCGILVVSSE
jgi:hypothetical protein